jgi:hypothetical protein
MKPFLWSILFLLCFLPVRGFSQLNEDRIIRDASGVFVGKLFGGTMTFIYPETTGAPTPVTMAGPTNRGKARVPVTDGKAASVLRDSEIGGDNSATVKGTAKDPAVLRNGKLIRTGGRGNVVNPGSGSVLTGARADGTFTDKGPKWQANFGGQGSQVFDAGGKWVYTGRKATGNG